MEIKGDVFITLYISGSGIGWLVGGFFIGEAFLAFDHSRNTIICHSKILHKHCLQILLGVKMQEHPTGNFEKKT